VEGFFWGFVPKEMGLHRCFQENNRVGVKKARSPDGSRQYWEGNFLEIGRGRKHVFAPARKEGGTGLRKAHGGGRGKIALGAPVF